MKRLLLALMLIVVLRCGFSQVANYDFFAFRNGNMVNVNPAWVTKDEGINVVLNSQILGTSMSYANKNVMAGIYSRTGNNSGLGLKVISDSRGAFQVLRADLSYGFHAQLSEGHSLRMGVLAGINNSNLNVTRIDNYQLIDLSDPTLSSNYYNSTQFVAGAGLLYSFHNLDISASLPQIISTSQPFNTYLNAAAFYKINAGRNFVIQPWISYQSIPVTKKLVGGYVKASYKDLLWVQTGYQNNKSFATAAGVFYENIGISYGFRVSNPEFKQIAGAIHEVSFTLRINNKKSKKDKLTATTPSTLDEINKRLDVLLSQDVTRTNRSELRAELNTIKEMLAKADIDNSDPGKSKLVEQQLILIEEKLRVIEEKLLK